MLRSVLSILLFVAGVSCTHGAAAPSTSQAAAPETPAPSAPASGALVLTASNWATISTPANFRLTNDANGSLTFDFPTAPDSMGYLYSTRPPTTIAGTVIVTLQVTTTGAPVFSYAEPGNSCVVPATVRPFIWANRNSNGDFDRWWANPTAYRLAEGLTTLSVPLNPDQWSAVNGKFGTADAGALAGFQGALSHVSRLGLTFGGGCFFGHGVDVYGGTARFVLSAYRIM